ncbi:insulinase family protein [Thaumasiovibrio subtropicus]|uniref:insulinase family protein n=1 Tax=Thaumasiovibrio subtropicus TaxID=1891207 RepID=UPI000B34C6BA|nr:insulinase family protein [Thaumasiovibrio subtropicus]
MHVSPNDSKQYQHLVLDNQLRVLLVHDSDATRSAAALSVEIGHFDDPEDRQGMAHFLEHMLFLGTEKYPKVGDFQSFINLAGGSNNAWTGTENTTFFFDVRPNAFAEGLDRFGQFFTAPLFNSDAVDKERNAVDSEYKLKISDDTRRIYQVYKETINPLHPFSKFSVGSLSTLNDRPNQSVRDDLIAFYQQNYSSHRMGLVLMGPQPLEQLEKFALSYFNDVPFNNTHSTPISVPFLTEREQAKFIRVEPIKDVRKLTLSFALPNIDEHYRVKPLSYIAHLIGYEGPGSLMSSLKSQELINALAAGGGLSGSNFREFTISVNLTPKGLSRIDEIVEEIFSYIARVRTTGLQSWRYDEKCAVLESAFRFQEKSRPLDTVSYLVLNLLNYAPEDIVYGDYMMQAYDEGLIIGLLDLLIPANMRLTMVARGVETDRVAKWYDTPYAVEPFTPLQLKKWSNAMLSPQHQLPTQNPFITESLDPKPIEDSAGELPTLLQELPGFRLWHKQDSEFHLPKGVMYIAIDSPAAVASVRSIVKTRLCVEMLLEACNEAAYQAEIAGLGYNLYAHQGGVTLQLSGFSQKQPLLLQLLLDKFTRRDFNEERFHFIKAQMTRNWQNATKEKPISQLFNTLSGLLQPNNPPYAELLRELETITLEELPSFVESILSELHIDAFIYGDWLKSDALKIAETLKDTFRVIDQKYGEVERPLHRLEGLGTGLHELKIDHDDSAILVYYQSPNKSPKAVATYTLANHLMSATFFHQLRTKQQLGYMVGTANMPLNRYPGIIFYIQSPLKGTEDLHYAIDEFINAFALELLELSDEQWESSKAGLIAQISEPDTNLRARAQRYWVAIGNKDTEFNHRQKVADSIRSLQRIDMIKFVVETLKPRSADRIIMYSQGKKHHELGSLNHWEV